MLQVCAAWVLFCSAHTGMVLEKLSRRLTSALTPRTIRARDLLDGSFVLDGSHGERTVSAGPLRNNSGFHADDSRQHEAITMMDLDAPDTPPKLQHRTGSGSDHATTTL